MEFIINKESLQEPLFYREGQAFSGVNKIVGRVAGDIEQVFGQAPITSTDRSSLSKYPILHGTVGRSPLAELDVLIDLSEIREEEAYYTRR